MAKLNISFRCWAAVWIRVSADFSKLQKFGEVVFKSNFSFSNDYTGFTGGKWRTRSQVNAPLNLNKCERKCWDFIRVFHFDAVYYVLFIWVNGYNRKEQSYQVYLCI